MSAFCETFCDATLPGAQPATAGHGLGIIAVDLDYPKLPGNVANASSFDFPVVYEVVKFEIERLFAGDPSIRQMVVDAALSLEARGVRAVVGACGYFIHFQKEVAAALHVPVFMSSLLQLPLIGAGIGEGRSVAIMAADGPSLTAEVLASAGGQGVATHVVNVGHLESFAPIRFGGGVALDNKALRDDLAQLACQTVAEHPDCGAILLECSDLPPYAWAIQQATGLPVFDFQTLIKLVWASVSQHPYAGII